MFRMWKIVIIVLTVFVCFGSMGLLRAQEDTPLLAERVYQHNLRVKDDYPEIHQYILSLNPELIFGSKEFQDYLKSIMIGEVYVDESKKSEVWLYIREYLGIEIATDANLWIWPANQTQHLYLPLIINTQLDSEVAASSINYVTYDRDAAVKYATNYAKDYNEEFPNFNYVYVIAPGGGDCTNFASQVAVFGGFPMTAFQGIEPLWWLKGGVQEGLDNNNWFYKKRSTPIVDLLADIYTLSWSTVNNFREYMMNAGNVVPYAFVINESYGMEAENNLILLSNMAKPGDFVQLFGTYEEFSAYEAVHTMVVVGKDSSGFAQLAYHTTPTTFGISRDQKNISIADLRFGRDYYAALLLKVNDKIQIPNMCIWQDFQSASQATGSPCCLPQGEWQYDPTDPTPIASIPVPEATPTPVMTCPDKEGVRFYAGNSCWLVEDDGVSNPPPGFQPDRFEINWSKVREVDLCTTNDGSNPCHTTSQSGSIVDSSVYGNVGSVKIHLELSCDNPTIPGVYIYNNSGDLCQYLDESVSDRTEIPGGAFAVARVRNVGNIQTELFRYQGFEGDSTEVNSEGSSELDQKSWGNGFQSVRVHWVQTCTDVNRMDGVTLTYEENFKADCEQHFADIDLPHMGNNVQSIRVGYGFQLYGYFGENFTNLYKVWQPGESSPDVDERYWSFQVRKVIPTSTPTVTSTPVPTFTSTSTQTPSPTNTATQTSIPTATNTGTLIPTNTPLPTSTETFIPTNTPTSTSTNTPTLTPTPELITNLVVQTGRSYLVDVSNVGTQYYIDRSYSFQQFKNPQEQGRVMVRTSNEDNNSSSGNVFSFDLGQRARITILYDRRGQRDLPDWMQSYQFQGDSHDVRVSGDSDMGYFKAYSQIFDPGTITFGGNHQGTSLAGSNYVVLIEPL